MITLSSILSRILTGMRATPGYLWRHKIATVVTTVIALPVLAVVWFAFSPARPEYVTDTAERGDLRQTVEAVGTVISDRDLNLQFGVSGIVSSLAVKEGDVVRAGQRLAQVRANNLAADIASASARVAQAQADLDEMQAGARPEDVAVTEAEVQNKRAALDAAKEAVITTETQLVALRSEIQTSLSGYVSTVGSTMTQKLTSAQNSLSTVEDVFNNNDVLDAAIKASPSEYNDIQSALQRAESLLSSLYGTVAAATEPITTLAAVDAVTRGITDASNVVNRAFSFISSLPESSSFSTADREAYKTQLTTERDAIQTALNGLADETKTFRDAGAGYTSQLVSQEAALTSAKSDVATLEATLRIAEAQLLLKKAPARQTDIDSARAVLQQYRASLARAQADYANTILTAPVAGVVTKVNIKAGEYTPAGAAITMLGESPYRIEMYVSEIDIPKVSVTQSGSVKLDAFPGEFFPLVVSQIDEAATDRDGVSKYRIRLDFIRPEDGERVKIGMTGDAIIITGFRQNVVSVPLRAVLDRDDGTQYVRVLENGEIEERTVETGMEGEGGTIETTGVEEGETVIVLVK